MNMYIFYNLMKLMNLSILRIRGGTLRRVKIIPSVRKLQPALRFGVGGRCFCSAHAEGGRATAFQYDEFNEPILFHCINEYQSYIESAGRLGWLQMGVALAGIAAGS